MFQAYTTRPKADGKPGRTGGLPYKKRWGAYRKFLKEPLRGTNIPFDGRGLSFFRPLEVPILKKTHLKLNVVSCEIPV